MFPGFYSPNNALLQHAGCIPEDLQVPVGHQAILPCDSDAVVVAGDLHGVVADPGHQVQHSGAALCVWRHQCGGQVTAGLALQCPLPLLPSLRGSRGSLHLPVHPTQGGSHHRASQVPGVGQLGCGGGLLCILPPLLHPHGCKTS